MTIPTLEASRRERDRLMHNYRIAKDKQFAELCAGSEYGVRLRKLVATLGHFGIGDSDRWIAYVESECRKWLYQAPVDIRFAVLEACDERIQKILLKAGLPPFDDSLPGEPPTVFDTCKKALGL